MRKQIVALMIEQDGKFLAEKRKDSEDTCPGDIVFPGREIKPGETNEQALIREMKEELGIQIFDPELVHEADFDCEKKLRILWFKCKGFRGKIQNNEAKELIWADPEMFTYAVSRDAISTYLKSK